MSHEESELDHSMEEKRSWEAGALVAKKGFGEAKAHLVDPLNVVVSEKSFLVDAQGHEGSELDQLARQDGFWRKIDWVYLVKTRHG